MQGLPERARHFLDVLQEFMTEPGMGEFSRGAREAFLGEEDEVGEDEGMDFVDYLMFGHVDGSGRSLVDHFLSARGAGMVPEERQILEGFGKSVYGVFHVEKVEPGRGFTLRRSGSDERFEVVDVSGSRSIRHGMGVFTRLVPYRGHHEVSGNLRVISREAAYVSDRIAARIGVAAAEKAMDPITMRRLFKPHPSRPSPPENRLEAELHAGSVFAELKFPLSVEEVQHRFQSLESPVDLLKMAGVSYGSVDELQRLMDAMTTLWNHTPRNELGGVSPEEKREELAAAGRRELPHHLLEDLESEVVSKIDPDSFPDDESRLAAIREVQERWLSTPQKELGGRTPREVMEGSIPPLPEESSLPPTDRPAWTLERIRGFLASERPASVLWAVQHAATRPEPLEGKEIIPPVARLLDHDDEEIIERTLAALRVFTRHPAARELAAAVAERLPSFGEGTHGHRLALEALGKLAPAEHVQAFGDGLDSGDEWVEIAALKGFAAAQGEGSVINLLGFMDVTSNATAAAAAALAGLVDLRAADFAERGAQAFIQRFSGEGEDEAISLGSLCADIEEALDVPKDLFVRVEGSLFPCDEEPGAAAVRWSVFFPTQDPVASRRAAEVIGPECADRILALADAGKHAELTRLLGALALEAIERASRENPRFGDLGMTLAGIVRSVLEWEGLRALAPDDAQVAASFLGSLLAKAVRGHDITREVKDAEGDRMKLLDLCRVDESWVDDHDFEILARALREEDAVSLSRSSDESVRSRGAFLLAAMDPARHAKSALAMLAGSWSLKFTLFRGLVRVAGDALLTPLVDAVREDPKEWALDLLATALEILGTERARACLENSFDALWRIDVLDLLEAAIATGSRVAAEKAISLIREGAFDIQREARFAPDLDDLRTEVEACLAVLEIPGDADEILAEALREAGELASFAEDHEDPFDDVEEEGEDEDEDEGYWPGWDEPDAPEPVEPIVRDAPKIGRNAPCPCGSGKKYKKCCGKGS